MSKVKDGLVDSMKFKLQHKPIIVFLSVTIFIIVVLVLMVVLKIRKEESKRSTLPVKTKPVSGTYEKEISIKGSLPTSIVSVTIAPADIIRTVVELADNEASPSSGTISPYRLDPQPSTTQIPTVSIVASVTKKPITALPRAGTISFLPLLTVLSVVSMIILAFFL